MFRNHRSQGAFALLAPVALVAFAGCASYPMPVQRMADAEAASRSAADTGAAGTPQAQLHLKLAQEEIAQAKQLMTDGDNKRADFVLIRAKSDAELSLAEARETVAAADAQKALGKINAMQSGDSTPPTSVTTTTSAVTNTPTSPSPAATSTTSTTVTTQGGKP